MGWGARRGARPNGTRGLSQAKPYGSLVSSVYQALRVADVCVYPPCHEPRVAMETGWCKVHLRQQAMGEQLHMPTPVTTRARGTTRYRPRRNPDGSYTVALLGSRYHVMTFDAIDLPVVDQVLRWRVEHDSWTSYAVAERSRDKTGPLVRTAAHRLILGSPPEKALTVDHLDGCGLNNRRSNLRWATKAEQRENRRRRQRRTRTSRYEGVRWTQWGWEACFRDHRDRVHALGVFEDETLAALEVDLAKLAEFGRHGTRFNLLDQARFRQLYGKT